MTRKRKRTLKVPRNRTIRWETSADALAEGLAHERQLPGGVSQLLELLVLAESRRKRGLAHLEKAQPATPEAA